MISSRPSSWRVFTRGESSAKSRTLMIYISMSLPWFRVGGLELVRIMFVLVIFMNMFGGNGRYVDGYGISKKIEFMIIS